MVKRKKQKKQNLKYGWYDNEIPDLKIKPIRLLPNITYKIKKGTNKYPTLWDMYSFMARGLIVLQPVCMLENIEHKGWRKYHIDHIVSVSTGFLNFIPFELIADISNLQMLHYKDNIIKSGNTKQEDLYNIIQKVFTLQNY